MCVGCAATAMVCVGCAATAMVAPLEVYGG